MCLPRALVPALVSLHSEQRILHFVPDLSVWLHRKSDPFVVLKRNHADEARTRVVKASLNPQWDEHFAFADCTAADLLTFELFDKVSHKAKYSMTYECLGSIHATV